MITGKMILPSIGSGLNPDGQWQIAVYDSGNGVARDIYISSDFGQTWNPVGTSLPFACCGLSKTGQYMTAMATNYLPRISSDYGETWSNAAGGNLPQTRVAVSGSGQYQTVAMGNTNYIYRSTNYGNSWVAVTGPGTNIWWGVDTSLSGQYQALVGNSKYIYNQVYVSSDYGATWSAKSSGTSGSARRAIGVSGDGQYMTAGLYSGYMWRSSDFGATWSQNTSAGSRSWQRISISGDGQYQSAVAYNNYIWRSEDYGVTWSQATSDATRSWSGLSVSNSGEYQSACSLSGYIWRSQDFGVTWSAVTGTGSKNWKDIAVAKHD